MLNTEYVKNLHSNYERLMLEEKPQERKYQYCILSRGGIKGILPCSLRYMNGDAYLYYDITSKQNIKQMFRKRKISREWVKDFFWSVQMVRMELERFLLDTGNIIWFPEHIYQELENTIFTFFYVPYYEGENGFGDFLDFLVEKIDYEDTMLVECIYKMYEQYENSGDVYFQSLIFEDVKMLEQNRDALVTDEKEESGKDEEDVEEVIDLDWKNDETMEWQHVESASGKKDWEAAYMTKTAETIGKRGIFSIFDGRKGGKKQRNKKRTDYNRDLKISMEAMAVAEEFEYEAEDFGQTIYIEAPVSRRAVVRRLYAEDGRVLAKLTEESCTIGKKNEDVDLVLEDKSISRIHARITKEGEEYFLEDMNSTNGTYKNGLRLQPYEKRLIQEEDEITLGAVTMTFR